MSTVTLAVVLCLVVGGAVAVCTLVGRHLRDRPGVRHEPVGVVQGTLLGLVGLLLAFGLTMAVGRYDTRRALLVHEADTIGTTFLRAQLLGEPTRSASLDLLERYADAAVDRGRPGPGLRPIRHHGGTNGRPPTPAEAACR